MKTNKNSHHYMRSLAAVHADALLEAPCCVLRIAPFHVTDETEVASG